MEQIICCKIQSFGIALFCTYGRSAFLTHYLMYEASDNASEFLLV